MDKDLVLDTLFFLYRRIRLFLSIVWRKWEHKSWGIPDEYRLSDRISIKTAWEVAKIIWN